MHVKTKKKRVGLKSATLLIAIFSIFLYLYELEMRARARPDFLRGKTQYHGINGYESDNYEFETGRRWQTYDGRGKPINPDDLAASLKREWHRKLYWRYYKALHDPRLPIPPADPPEPDWEKMAESQLGRPDPELTPPRH